MKYVVFAFFVAAVVFFFNWLINKFYEKELENVPNCEAADEVNDRKRETKLNLVWVILICIVIADKFII